MNKKEESSIGFHGIGKRVEDILNNELEDINKHHDSQDVRKAESQSPVIQPDHNKEKKSDTGSSAPKENTTSKYIFISMIVVAAIIGYALTSSSPPTKTSPPVRAVYPSPAPAPAPEKAPERPAPAPTPAPIPVTKFDPEEKPPVGSGLRFSTPQIRYCVYEKVRVEAMRDIIDSNYQVTIFNHYVDDYNSRCTNFRYRRGSLQAVQSEVSAKMSVLRREGRSRF